MNTQMHTSPAASTPRRVPTTLQRTILLDYSMSRHWRSLPINRIKFLLPNMSQFHSKLSRLSSQHDATLQSHKQPPILDTLNHSAQPASKCPSIRMHHLSLLEVQSRSNFHSCFEPVGLCPFTLTSPLFMDTLSNSTRYP